MKVQQEPRRDEGFTLVEVIVSMLIFAVLSSAVLGLVVKTLQTTTKSSSKNAAATLADAKKEYLVGAPWNSVVSGRDVVDASGAPWTAATQGAAYTVDTTVTLVPNTSNFCATNGAELSRKLIAVAVTWPGMSSSDKVTNTTFRRIYQADAATAAGAAAWQLNTPVFAADGTVSYTGLSGISATAYDGDGAVAGTGTSDASGCVFISNLDAGSYTLVVDRSGYLGQDNVQRQEATLTVQAGKISVPSDALRYAPSSSAKLSVSTVAGYNPPSTMTNWTGYSSMFFADTIGGYNQRTACAAGASPLTTPCLGSDGTVGRLYPKAYSGYLGLCDGNKATTTDFTPRWTAADVPAATMRLGAAYYSVPALPVALASGTWAVTAVRAGNASCSGQTLDLGTVASNASTKVALPLGTWTLIARNANGGTVSKAVTVTTTAPATATLLTVV